MITIVDLTDYLSGQPGALERTAREIHDAFSRIGFFVIALFVVKASPPAHQSPPQLMS